MTILGLLNQIQSGAIVLPAIQRDFLWTGDKILRLLDSILQGHPIGMVLLWETYLDIQYRLFVSDFRPGQPYSFKDNRQRKKLRLVLDGQQRLQSLYLALFGTYDGKSLYLDILSGPRPPDPPETRYELSFLGPGETPPGQDISQSRSSSHFDATGPPRYFLKVSDLLACGAREKNLLKKRVHKELSLSEEDRERMDLSLASFDEVLSRNTNILKVSILDEDLPSESHYRKSESEALNIFLRTNREGAPLSRADLIFSMLKLHWRESAEILPEFLREINRGNAFELDVNFVIRCLAAVSGLGTTLDLKLLGKPSNIERLRVNFSACCDAIRSTVDCLMRDCGCSSSDLVGGQSTLVPFVFYLFNARRHEIPNGQTGNFRKALYVFGFAKPFSRFADGRLHKFIQRELVPLANQPEAGFPFAAAVWWVNHWEGYHALTASLLLNNPSLTLHVVQNLGSPKVQYWRNAEELDHIFPRSELRRRGFDEAEINHVANLWILPMGRNRNKSNQPPAQYLKDVDDFELQRALIDRELLDYSAFRVFLKRRTLQIMDQVRSRLQFTEQEFWSAHRAGSRGDGGFLLSLRRANVTSDFLNAMFAKQTG